MKNSAKIFLITFIAAVLYFGFSAGSASAGKAACDAFLYISNNSLFEINVTIDGIPSGNILVGKNKTYTVSLTNDTPKKIKVKVEYQDPDYIDPKSINYITKEKMECGKSDSMFIAFTK
jgi:hypothetical protein